MKMRKIYCVVTLLASICLTTGCKKEQVKQDTVPVKVKTETVQPRPTNGDASFSATVEEESGTVLSFTAGGTLRSLNASQGQMIQKGALLGVVNETTLRNAYESARAIREQAEDAYRRMKLLHDNKSLPEIQWIEVQSKLKQAVAAERIARKSLSDSRLYAPFSGYVSEKMAEAGQNVMPGMPILKIVKIDRVKVKMAVPENEIANIRKGETVTVQVDALGGKTYKGIITEKGVTANPLSRSYDVKALVANPNHDLLPGMVCNTWLNGTKGTSTAILLPPEVINIDGNNRQFVWLKTGGKATKRYIETGEQTTAGVIITSGLSGGEEVIVEGQQKVSEGTTVTR